MTFKVELLPNRQTTQYELDMMVQVSKEQIVWSAADMQFVVSKVKSYGDLKLYVDVETYGFTMQDREMLTELDRFLIDWQLDVWIRDGGMVADIIQEYGGPF